MQDPSNARRPAEENTSAVTSGVEEVAMRLLGAFYDLSEGRNRMSDKAEQRLLTFLSIGISIGLSLPLARFIEEKIPERRGIRDDVTEAVLQGIVRAVALTLASVIVRQIAASRR